MALISSSLPANIFFKSSINCVICFCLCCKDNELRMMCKANSNVFSSQHNKNANLSTCCIAANNHYFLCIPGIRRILAILWYLCTYFVNIILKKNNSYTFALQKPPFWLPKTLVLHAKTDSFAMRNSSFYKVLITMLLCEYFFLWKYLHFHRVRFKGNYRCEFVEKQGWFVENNL